MKKLLLLLVAFLSLVGFVNAQWFWLNPLPQGNALYSIKFTDVNTAVAVGSGGIIIKTTNAGFNWISQNMESNKTLKTLSFISSGDITNIAYAVGVNGTICKTTMLVPAGLFKLVE